MDVQIIQAPDGRIPTEPMGTSRIYVLPNPFDAAKPNSKYYLVCHKCNMGAALTNHEITWNDGKPTINPSISCPNESECDAHYWIKDGQVV